MPLSRDEAAQTNIDFLFGLAVFLMAFLYVFTFVPGLFVPYQASAIDLSSVAYKTGAILVEDPGWYIYTIDDEQVGNPAWEDQPLSQLARIGLADSKLSPNVLSMDKIEALGDITSYEIIRDKIGLAGTLTYNFSLSLTMNDTMVHRQVELLNITPQYKGNSVEYMERNVMVDTGKQLFVDGYTQDMLYGAMHIGLASIPAGDNSNVTIRIYNATGPGCIKSILWQDVPEGSIPGPSTTPMMNGEDFIIRKNGVEVPLTFATFGPGDTIEIDIFRSKIDFTDMDSIWITSIPNVFPISEIDYYDDPTYRLNDVCYPGKFKVEVWSNDFA